MGIRCHVRRAATPRKDFFILLTEFLYALITVTCNVCVSDTREKYPSVQVNINHVLGNRKMRLFLAQQSHMVGDTTDKIPLR
jgi:hypothetical protein